jgi:hypothetical protein
VLDGKSKIHALTTGGRHSLHVHDNKNAVYSEHDHTQYGRKWHSALCLNVSLIPPTSVHYTDDESFKWIEWIDDRMRIGKGSFAKIYG